MPEKEALRKIEAVMEPKIIRLVSEDSAPMPVQSIIDVAQIAAEMLREVNGERVVETMSPEFVGFIEDAYRSLKYEK